MSDWNGLLSDMTATLRDTFGEPVLYERGETGETFEVVAIFDPAHELLDTAGGVPVSSRIPVLDVRVADIGGEPEHDDFVTVRGTRYRVLDAVPSSSGMMKCHLRK